MTPPSESLLSQVQTALRGIPDGDFPTTATRLLDVLGYQSERLPPDQTGQAADFVKQFPARIRDTKTEKELLAHDPTVRILSQVTDTEIGLSSQGQLTLEGFDLGDLRSFVFAAVDLKQDTSPRGQYARFTREINKRLMHPTVVLFRTTNGKLTIAFMERRPDLRDGKRDVLGRVSLIREIDTEAPHPAHVRIIAELSLQRRLDWMQSHNKRPNFEGLLEAWLSCLDIEALNKHFYDELFEWFENAVAQATFPTVENPSTEEHIIRLITRLLFVWFIKEKGLVDPDLFNKDQVRPLLRGYDQNTGDSYYRAILQNLFFATLNTKIGERGFNGSGFDSDFSRYHYQDEISQPDHLISMFAKTPFINGGLFDCLDSPNPTASHGLIDCFSNNPDHQSLLSVPNRLFFGPTGLIDLFEDYWFTVEENTPIEQDVALDPELLGRVFENLLAAFNPETGETARKRSGSFYTPRQVVDYMVTEALVAHWAGNVPYVVGDDEYWEARLRYLLDYADEISDADEFFEPAERQALLRSIANIKVLDPAVGSGAFPMAILHRLILALQRLDEANEEWQQIQEGIASELASRAFRTSDQQQRNKYLLQISDTFEKYRSDFGRKLYLIQNSIYGVDIQPIACQIAKLRVFVSLAIEQQPNRDPHDNYGVRPLPNLETKFVAADSIQGLKGQQGLNYPVLWQLDEDLRSNRELHFHAVTTQEKREISAKDADMRSQMATALQSGGMSPDQARRVADWNPYDQNSSADWFDTKYMFNMTDGFDIVIGNPPYIQLQTGGSELAAKYEKAGYTTFAKSGDMYVLFYEKGCQLLKPTQGVLAYITSNSWMKAQYGKQLRRHLAEQHTPLILLEMGKDVFDAVVDTNILLLREGGNSSPFPAVDRDTHHESGFPPPADQWGRVVPSGADSWVILSPVEQRVLGKMKTKGTPLSQWPLTINRGVTTGYNQAFIIDQTTRDALISEDPNADDIIKPILRGRDLRPYQDKWADLYVIATIPARNIDITSYPAVMRHLLSFGKDRLGQVGKPLLGGGRSRKKTSHSWFELQDAISYYKEFRKAKLFWTDLSPEGRFVYSDAEMYCLNTAFCMTGPSLKYLQAVLNSSLMAWFVHKITLTTGMGEVRWIVFIVERLLVPQIPSEEQQRFTRVVDRVLAAKAADPPVDTTELEAEIDRMVYDLYGLTPEEIQAVETRLPVHQ